MRSAGVTIGLALAVVCALGTNVGWLIKHRGAQRCPPMRHRRPLRSVRTLFRSRWFTVGLLVASLAGLLHIAALALAPISVVQAVMAGGVVILAVLAQRVFACRVSRRQWWGVTLASLGLAVLGFSLPAIRGAHSHFSAEVMVLFEALLLGASLLLLGASRMRRLAAYDGVLIGAAAGIFFGISDVGVKALVGVANSGALALLVSPWLAVVLASGVLAQYVSARSLQSGDAISVAALTGLAINFANIAGGIVVFGDPVAHGTAGSLAEVVAFALICAAALLTPAPAVDARASRPRGAPRRPAWPGLARARVALRSAAVPSRAASLRGLLAFAGVTLLAVGELADRLEPTLGMGVLNLLFSVPLALTAVAVVAVLGDMALEVLERHLAYRPGAGAATLLLASAGAATALMIGVDHMRRLPHLDASLGLAGSLMLVLVVGLHVLARSARSDAPLGTSYKRS